MIVAQSINPYHVIVRKHGGDPSQPKMGLQLYQVDSRSYLLDFKSLVDEEGSFLHSLLALAFCRRLVAAFRPSDFCIPTDRTYECRFR